MQIIGIALVFKKRAKVKRQAIIDFRRHRLATVRDKKDCGVSERLAKSRIKNTRGALRFYLYRAAPREQFDKRGACFDALLCKARFYPIRPGEAVNALR